MPNRMNTQGYTALVDHPNGAAHFGAWCAIVEICSAREPKEMRGVLPEGDGTIGGISRVLGRISRLPPEIFQELLPRLISDPEIKWLEKSPDASGKSPDPPGDAPEVPGRKGREGEGTEGEGKEQPNTAGAKNGAALVVLPTPSGRFEEWWDLWSSVKGTNHHYNAEQVYPRQVTNETEGDCFECTRSYLESISNPAKGYNPENFLIEQGRDKFKARWPRARDSPVRPSGTDAVMELAKKNLERTGRIFG